MGKNTPDMPLEQVNFINSLGLPFVVTGKAEDFEYMSDDDFFMINDAVMGALSAGITKDDDVDEKGRMAESILDYFGEYF